jgi:hypothetical protein
MQLPQLLWDTQDAVLPRRTLCDPYLNLFRGLIPPLGGTIDLSPILAFIVLDVRGPRAMQPPCRSRARKTSSKRCTVHQRQLCSRPAPVMLPRSARVPGSARK